MAPTTQTANSTLKGKEDGGRQGKGGSWMMISVENITMLLIMNEDETRQMMRQHPSVWFPVMVEMRL